MSCGCSLPWEYGADIGGFSSVGTSIPDVGTQPAGGYYPVADKDRLTEALCRARHLRDCSDGQTCAKRCRADGTGRDGGIGCGTGDSGRRRRAAARCAGASGRRNAVNRTDDSSSNGSTELDSIAPEPDASDATPDVSATPETAETAEPVSGTPSETASDPGTDSEASQGCRSTAAPTLLLLIALAAAPILTAGRAGRRQGRERSKWVGGAALRCVSCFCLPPAVSGQQLRTDGVRMRGRLRTASSRGRNAMSAHSRTAVF